MWVAAAHAAVGAVALVLALGVNATPVLGAHPALKPMKFGFSIALFLATMAVLVPALSLRPQLREVAAWTLAATMIAEMIPIVVQAARGTTSHFNSHGTLDSAFWRLMFVAIVIATVTTLIITVVATARPLLGPDQRPWSPLLATAWRAGLWFFVLAAFTGFRMGGQLAHSVGGVDGGPGAAVTTWSRQHGDLRVPHFIGVHALQSLPLVGYLLARAPVETVARWGLLIAAVGVHVLLAVVALGRALAGRPW